MDVGAGSGLLSYFSLQAGASHVFAVEASSVADVIPTIAEDNGWGADRLTVVKDTVEGAWKKNNITEKVDVMVSEPIGIFLFYERMIESVLFARDKFLKPGGRLFPGRARLYLAPFSHAALRQERKNRFISFWRNSDFLGVNLTAASSQATRESYSQVIVDIMRVENLFAMHPQFAEWDFERCSVAEIQNLDLQFEFDVVKTGLLDGITGWFEAFFDGSTVLGAEEGGPSGGEEKTFTLSTAPDQAPTHWSGTSFLFQISVFFECADLLAHKGMHPRHHS